MSRPTIQRIAALPLTLALVGVALMALSALPAAESEQPSAQAATAPLAVDADAASAQD